MDELTLFETPAELHARLVDEWWAARTVAQQPRPAAEWCEWAGWEGLL